MGRSMNELAKAAIENVGKKNETMKPNIETDPQTLNFYKKAAEGSRKREQINIKFSASVSKVAIEQWCEDKGVTVNDFFQKAALFVMREVDLGNLAITRMEGIIKK